MAYTRKNYLKHVKKVLAVYSEIKKPHIPDTFLVRVLFPQHDIHISYRKWMMIKGMKPSNFEGITPSANQPQLRIAV